MSLKSDLEEWFKKVGHYEDPWGNVDCVLAEDEITDTTRWAIVHEAIYNRKTIANREPLTFSDEFVRVTYSEPATELQDWDELDEVECVEVEPVEIKKIVYRVKE